MSRDSWRWGTHRHMSRFLLCCYNEVLEGVKNSRMRTGCPASTCLSESFNRYQTFSSFFNCGFLPFRVTGEMETYPRDQENRQGTHTTDPLTHAEEQFILLLSLWTCWGGWRSPAEAPREGETIPQITRKPHKRQRGCPRIPDFLFILEIESISSQVNGRLTTQKSVVWDRDWYWSMVERTLRIRHARTRRNLQEGKQSQR